MHTLAHHYMRGTPLNPIYLGDGVYAQTSESGELVLTTDSHKVEEADNVIYLESSVITSLLEYINSSRKG